MLLSRLNLLKKLEWRHCEGGKRNVRGRNLKARAISSLLPGGQILGHRTKNGNIFAAYLQMVSLTLAANLPPSYQQH
jgi:hypothetical protein